jgi:Na+(H+)/acetate symporter ActP
MRLKTKKRLQFERYALLYTSALFEEIVGPQLERYDSSQRSRSVRHYSTPQIQNGGTAKGRMMQQRVNRSPTVTLVDCSLLTVDRMYLRENNQRRKALRVPNAQNTFCEFVAKMSTLTFGTPHLPYVITYFLSFLFYMQQ